MPRGGKREGAGAKPKWKHGKTTNIRVPEVLVEEVLRLAHRLDEGESFDFESESKIIDLSKISIGTLEKKKFVFLEGLLKAGYEIFPWSLGEIVRKQILGSVK